MQASNSPPNNLPNGFSGKPLEPKVGHNQPIATLNAESMSMAFGVLLIAIALIGLLYGVNIPQHANYHGFADRRALFGLPFASDVLSNLPFALIGFYGLFSMRTFASQNKAFNDIQNHLLSLSFWGLILTCAASGFYHWAPDNYGLVIDRMGMTCAFAGVIGVAVASRISDRAGLATAFTILALAPFAIVHWHQTDNLWLWSVLQGGGMIALVALAFRRATEQSYPIQLGWIIAFYVIAKVFELSDHQVFEATQQFLSGHTIKHLAAALAAWPLIKAVQNSRKIAA